MPTPSGHTRAIAASRVKGTSVYNTDGEKIGHVEDVILDKLSNTILFAALGFGGLFGIGEKYHPVPWSILDFDEALGGYRVALTRESLERAPSYAMPELTDDDGRVRDEAYRYYGVNVRD